MGEGEGEAARARVSEREREREREGGREGVMVREGGGSGREGDRVRARDSE